MIQTATDNDNDNASTSRSDHHENFSADETSNGSKLLSPSEVNNMQIGDSSNNNCGSGGALWLNNSTECHHHSTQETMRTPSSIHRHNLVSDSNSVARDFVEKIFNLKVVLRRDILASDAKWTLFVAAALTYRYDVLLKPAPPGFRTSQGEFDIDSLVNIINETPSLHMILTSIEGEEYEDLSTDVIDLLHWVLIEQNEPKLRTVSFEEFDTIFESLSIKSQNMVRPTSVFEVLSSPHSNAEEAFQKHCAEYDTSFAFHGSKLDCFYSILNHGLNQHLCKNGVFGEGVYLSSDINVARYFSTNDAAWGASLSGQLISCVAFCEYVKHPFHAKFSQANRHNIPKEYLVVTNNEIVRVRYLLFYGSKLSDTARAKDVALSWVKRNKYTLAICCYTLFLASIGIVNSGNYFYFKHLINRKAYDLMKVMKGFFEQ